MRELSRNLSFLALLALLSISRWTAAQAALKTPFVRVRWSEATLHITFQTARIDHDFRESDPNLSKPEYERFWLAWIDAAHTRRLLEKGGRVYMLLDVEGPSVGGGNANCGAGTEKALGLFVFDSEGLFEEPRVINYESCFQNIGQEDVPGYKEEPSSTPMSSRQSFVQAFSLRREGQPDPITVEVKFDPLHPELGLIVKENPGDPKTGVPLPGPS